MNGASGFPKVRSSASRSLSSRFLHEQRRQSGKGPSTCSDSQLAIVHEHIATEMQVKTGYTGISLMAVPESGIAKFSLKAYLEHQLARTVRIVEVNELVDSAKRSGREWRLRFA